MRVFHADIFLGVHGPIRHIISITSSSFPVSLSMSFNYSFSSTLQSNAFLPTYPSEWNYLTNFQFIPLGQYVVFPNHLKGMLHPFENILFSDKARIFPGRGRLKVKSGVGLCFVRNLEQGKPTLRMDKVNQPPFLLLAGRWGSPCRTEGFSVPRACR